MTQFTAYSTIDSKDLKKGKPYIVYEVREEKGKTSFLVGTETGEFRWLDSSIFRENQRQAQE